jgi:hypothetical protein
LRALSRRRPNKLDEDFGRLLRAKFAERAQREKQQGRGKPIISNLFNEHRFVAVGGSVHFSKKWTTFHDFLRDYFIKKIGVDWYKTELSKPDDERHPIVRWYEHALRDARRTATKVGTVYSAPMTGAIRAFLNLAYNIYLIAHHANVEGANELLETVLTKLRSQRSDDFIGKLFETYAAAAFLKAGFKIEYEDESKGGDSKVEFVATYPKSGNKFSVEVKARNRSQSEDGPNDDVKRLRVASKLNKALAKKARYTRVVMIEVNVPDVITDPAKGWPQAALSQIRHAETMDPPDGSEKPSAYVVVTNHAFHNNLDDVTAGTQAMAAGCRIPDFGPDIAFGSLKDLLDCEERHAEMFALMDSMRAHYEIPSTFDGENPELAFGTDKDLPKLKFGDWYLIPDRDGVEVRGRLREAAVIEDKKLVMGGYETAHGRHIMASTPLSDVEMVAYRRHPETFFGEVRQVPHQSKNWLDLAKFFYTSYKNTPREKLLQWMKAWRDFEELSKLSQRDLAIAYCERIAASIEVEQQQSADA